LREDILVFPNSYRRSLDVYHVPSSADLELNPASDSKSSDPIRTRLIHAFRLPELQEGCYIASIEARCSPNPTATDCIPSYTPASTPYSNDPAAAIIFLKMALRNATDTSIRQTYNVVVPRKALLNLVPDGILQDVSKVIEELRAVRSAGGEESTDDAELAARLANASLQELTVRDIVMQPWEKWGPPITRWFNTSRLSNMFIATTGGQRCIQYAKPEPTDGENAPGKPNTIHILDFNPCTLKRAWNGLGRPGPFRGPKCTISIVGMMSTHGDAVEGSEAENILPNGGLFASDVVGRLPYVKCMSHEEWTYDGVIISEEMLIGLKVIFNLLLVNWNR